VQLLEQRVAVGSPVTLTFGAEERVQLQRTTVEEVRRRDGLFGTSQRFGFSYVFDVISHADAPLQVELAEHVPLSELEEIKVELDTQSAKIFQVGAADGIARTVVDLAPRQARAIALKYDVQLPGSFDTSGL
jgi:hypothetical protein